MTLEKAGLDLAKDYVKMTPFGKTSLLNGEYQTVEEKCFI